MIRQFFRQWFDELENLIFPQSCSGCGAWDTALCPTCTTQIGGKWSPIDAFVPALSRVVPAGTPRRGLLWEGDSYLPFPVWRLGIYEGARRNTIIRWKHQINRNMTARIAAQLRQRGRELAPFLLRHGVSTLLLIPAPSRLARKKEGLFIVGHTAHALCAGLNDGGVKAQVKDILRFEKKVSDRRAKATAISAHTPIPRGIPLALVDDVLVTGSTLSGCARALERQGNMVSFALVLAQRERHTTSSVPHSDALFPSGEHAKNFAQNQQRGKA